MSARCSPLLRQGAAETPQRSASVPHRAATTLACELSSSPSFSFRCLLRLDPSGSSTEWKGSAAWERPYHRASDWPGHNLVDFRQELSPTDHLAMLVGTITAAFARFRSCRIDMGPEGCLRQRRLPTKRS